MKTEQIYSVSGNEFTSNESGKQLLQVDAVGKANNIRKGERMWNYQGNHKWTLGLLLQGKQLLQNMLSSESLHYALSRRYIQLGVTASDKLKHEESYCLQ